MGQPGNAVAPMQAVADAKPPAVNAGEARLFLELNSLAEDPAKAEASAARVEAILRSRPDYVPALLALGAVRERAGDYPGARDTYERVLKLLPLFAPADKSLAKLYFEHLHDSTKAYEHANIAREAYPRDLEITRMLGSLAFERGDYSRSVQLLQECAATSRSDGELFYQLGMAQYKLKQNKESKVSLNKALALAPNSQLASEAKRLLAELD
jgi:tetratricopeptide (TPR) repeat protein